MLFRALDAARKAGDASQEAKRLENKIDNYETHVVPIIADIDAGFGNAEATYLLAKKMIEAGACALQIENQVSDEKQCGHQDGKVTVPHEDFLAEDPRLPPTPSSNWAWKTASSSPAPTRSALA
jgi:isocitrate lyase